MNRKLSIEGLVKIIGASACIVGDFGRIFRPDQSVDEESVQHHSMYAFFLLNGVVDVIYNAGFPFPANTDYVVLVLAITSEGLMLHLHLHGKTLLNTQTHRLLVYIVVAMIACLIAEMCRSPKHSGVPGSCLLLPSAWDVAMAARLHSLQPAAQLQALGR
ncbi:hypothetical protein HPB51_012418 [Rhipicephalus microplus]|uniref:Uncharacterized protein n=1 Tax=Rhipicephalus microplus TaxID=6941 RepID=A0A9J6E9E6_RHIMP|nr:hypothetical protein HPB51_012418 [Rhipicephalus microplus]